jgi:hypothetical protein
LDFDGAELIWNSEVGAEYYIQVVGDSPADFGSYRLEVQSSDDIEVVPVTNGE